MDFLPLYLSDLNTFGVAGRGTAQKTQMSHTALKKNLKDDTYNLCVQLLGKILYLEALCL